MAKKVCTPRFLTPAQAELARRRSLEVNPANASEERIITRTPVGRRGGPRRIVVDIGKRWPKSGVALSVSFLDTPSVALRKRILLHMNAWSKTANVKFRETRGTGQVRIARWNAPPDWAGYWSLVGTDILGIEDEDEPTMNLEGFTMRTSEAEFRRVVRHEAGHTLGFEHEHMRGELVERINRRKAFAYYDETEGWTRQETLDQVLTPLDQASVMGTTEADPTSIMCYQVPAEITVDGKEIEGGIDINPTDFAFAARLYPRKRPGKGKRDEEAAPPAPVAEDDGTETLDASAPLVTTPLPSPAAPVVEADTYHLVIMDRFPPDAAGAPEDQNAARFVRVFASYGGARVTAPMLVRAGKDQPRSTFYDIIRTHERIKKYTNRDSGSLPEIKDLLAFGGQLFDTLFQGEVRRLYDEARARQHGRRLDFVLTSMVPWIAEKPWEFAYDTSRCTFLATEDIHFVRNVLTSVPADVMAPCPCPLRILVASAQPVGFGRLSVAQESDVILRGFQPLIDAGLAQVDVLARATPRKIHQALATGKYTVVHFIGHGVFNEETQEGELVFEDERGGAIRIGERSARELFCKRGVMLVFLNACQTAQGSRSDFNKGVAQALVAHGLPALVANQYSVLDVSATQFARYFYWALAQGLSIGEAARESRIAVNYLIDGEAIDWAVPVVYARDPGMVVCSPATDAAATRVAAAAAQRAPAARPFEIAVWDIDNVFPDLEATVQRMSGAQTQFGFRVVDLSAPVDAWYLEERAEDGTPYLWAGKLAERLANVPAELHVNALVCITRHWMCDDEDLNIYGWWADAGGPPVVVFSCAGFDALPASGPVTDRVLANAMVMGLAGFLGDLDTHEHGPRNCPLWRNDTREFAHLSGLQSFDRACRSQLGKKAPGMLAALDALTRPFT